MKLNNHQTLSNEDLSLVFNNILNKNIEESEVINFLESLNAKTDLYEEIKILREAIYNNAIKITGFENAVDLCGTGGDSLNYINISTATAFVVASAGIKVAKHGNKGVSSKSGSSDVLTALGINVQQNIERVKASLNEIGIAFLFAPLYHPILKNVAPIRQKMAKRTIFNLLGPLLNPCHVQTQLIGVYDFAFAETICKVLHESGSKRVLVVNAHNGADEILTTGITNICELKDGKITKWKFDPKSIDYFDNDDGSLIGRDADYNALKITELLEGKKNLLYNNVSLNAGFVIYMFGIKPSIIDSVKYAESLIDSGKALDKLNQLKNFQ